MAVIMLFYGLLAPHLLHKCAQNLAYKDIADSDSSPPAIEGPPRSPLIFMFVSTATSGY